MGDGIFLYFFGGVSQEGSFWKTAFEQVLFELARWLLPISICLLAEGVSLENWRKIESFSCYRHEAVKIWWRRKFVRILLEGMSVAAVLLTVTIMIDVVGAVEFSGEIWKVLVLWIPHIMTIMSFFIVLDLTKYRKFAPAAILLLEGFTFLVGFRFSGIARFMYGMWGMYFQSEWYFGETGVPVITSLMADVILFGLSYLAGRILLERRYKAGSHKTNVLLGKA